MQATLLPLSLFAVPLALAGRPTDEVGAVDSDTGRVRCHWARPDDAGLCADVAAWAEEAWTAQVDRLGFQSPIPDGDLGGSDALDIYLTPEAGGEGTAWVDCDGGDPDCVDADPSDGLAGATSYVVMDPRTAREDLPHFVHHEFNHVLQYATDFAEPFLCLWEGTAVAAEQWTDPAWPTLVSDLADYQRYPWASAVLQDGYFLWDAYDVDAWYEYGAVVWVWWMDHRWGDGAGSIGPTLWQAVAQEGRGQEPDVLDAWVGLADDLPEDVLAFATDRARMGTPWGPVYTGFAGTDALAWREGRVVGHAEITPTFPPFPLGMSYWTLAVTPGEPVDLSLSSDADTAWGLLVVDGAGGAATQGTTLSYVPEGTEVTLGVVNLGPPDLDADDPLEAAPFTLTVGAGTGGGGCACATPGRRDRTAPGWAWLLVLGGLAAARRAPGARGKPTSRGYR